MVPQSVVFLGAEARERPQRFLLDPIFASLVCREEVVLVSAPALVGRKLGCLSWLTRLFHFPVTLLPGMEVLAVLCR